MYYIILDNGIGLYFALTFWILLTARMIIVKDDVGVDMILDSISISTLSIYFGNFDFLDQRFTYF